MGPLSDAHDPYEALRFPGYRRLLGATVLSSLGFAMQSTAVGWEMYERTESKAALGVVGLVQFVPVVVLALPAGQAADRFSRKGLFLLAQSMMAVATLGLMAVSVAPNLDAPAYKGLVYVCLFFVGVARAISAPARWSLVSQVVPTAALGNAITWNSSGWQVAATLGPALGGGVVALSGRATGAYVFAALLSLICIGLTVGIRPRPVELHTHPLTLDSLLAGIRFVWNTPLILATMTLDLFAVLLGGVTALLPIFAKDILHVGAFGQGYLRAAPAIGALVMAVVMAHRPPLRRAGRALLWSVAGFGVATVVFGLSRDPALSFAMLALTGALDNVSIVVRGTLVQLLTPDAMRGRVSAVNTIFIVSSNELGEFESGMTAELFDSAVASAVVGGIGTMLVVLAVMIRWPQVLRLGPLNDPTGSAAAQMAVEEMKEERIP
jgi:MFS family permease